MVGDDGLCWSEQDSRWEALKALFCSRMLKGPGKTQSYVLCHSLSISPGNHTNPCFESLCQKSDNPTPLSWSPKVIFWQKKMLMCLSLGSIAVLQLRLWPPGHSGSVRSFPSHTVAHFSMFRTFTPLIFWPHKIKMQKKNQLQLY